MSPWLPGSRELRVPTADGWVLSVLHLPARGAVRGTAVLGHAMMVDRRSMERPVGAGLASTLADGGWHVLLADLRGHGASGPTPGQGGRWSYDDLVFHDLPALVSRARAVTPDLPVALVGHSLAGHVAVAAAGVWAYDDDGAPDLHVLIGVNTWLRGLDPKRDLARARHMLAFEAVARLLGRFPAKRLRMGPADESGVYARDLARFFWSGAWRSADGAHDYGIGRVCVTGPILALVGARDRLMAHPEAVRRWMAELETAEVDLRVLDRGDLGLTQAPGHMEIVTDPGSRGVWAEILRWMDLQAG